MLTLEKVRQAEDDIGSRINNMLLDNNRSPSASVLHLSKENSPVSANLRMCIQAEKERSLFPSPGRRSVSSELRAGLLVFHLPRSTFAYGFLGRVKVLLSSHNNK